VPPSTRVAPAESSNALPRMTEAILSSPRMRGSKNSGRCNANLAQSLISYPRVQSHVPATAPSLPNDRPLHAPRLENLQPHPGGLRSRFHDPRREGIPAQGESDKFAFNRNPNLHCRAIVQSLPGGHE
jgi:hypothetical protein